MTHTIDELQDHVDEKFRELDKKIDKLSETKQDKLPRGTLISVGIAMLAQLVLLAYVAGSLTTELDQATVDRYTGSAATRDFALRDQRDANIETELLEHSVRIEELRQRIRALENGDNRTD